MKNVLETILNINVMSYRAKSRCKIVLDYARTDKKNINLFLKNSLYLLFLPFFSFAQWETDAAVNNPLCIQTNDQKNVAIVSDGKGGIISVWEDYRNSTSAADIYAQRIDANGTIKWTLNGVSICSNAANQTNPVIISDTVGGAIIVWEDYRGTKRNLYAQRIDSLGNVLWTANGLAVTARNFEQKNAKVLKDGAQGAIVIWQDSSSTAYDIFAQRLNNNGVAQWSTGVYVCAATGAQSNPKAQINSSGDMYVCWQDKRNGSDWDVYAQKLNLSGTAQWTANGINLCNYAENQSNPKIVLDNVEYPIIAWQDKRNGTDYDIYAQRLNPSGAIQWSANGTSVCTATGTQNQLDLTTQGITGGCVIAWKDARNGNTNTDIYAQFVNANGTKAWTANGVVVANNVYNQINPNLTGDDSSGVVVAYQDSSDGNWNIRAQRLNKLGNRLWNTLGVDVGVAASSQTNADNIKAKGGDFIFAFQDKRSGDYDIYAYRLDAQGVSGIVKNKQEAVINVFPNPASGEINFSFPSKGQLKIMNIDGKEIFDRPINKDARIITSALTEGIYFYSFLSNGKTANGKFIIVK